MYINPDLSPMAKERIVIETSEARKQALTSRLDIQGRTITEWFDDQLTIFLENDTQATNRNISLSITAADLSDTQKIMDELKSLDWSFHDDDTQYLTHDIHPYPAKYIPQIPSVIIGKLSIPGDFVLDPFGGSGTTAVEAIRLGRKIISIDANPLAALIGRVKTGTLDNQSKEQLGYLRAAIESYSMKCSNRRKVNQLLNDLAKWIPPIPNMDRWFSPQVTAELALIRHLINEIASSFAHDISNLAMSKIIVRVSNQDSETRYTSREKDIPSGFTIQAFLDALSSIETKVTRSSRIMQFADANFITGDSRERMQQHIQPHSIGLVVTSPPYPNATDYHLYHRFRLFWLGYDPRNFGNIEIGSHLRHQRDGSGFSAYCDDMRQSLISIDQVLQPGRYAAFIIGDAVFNGTLFSTSDAIISIAKDMDYTICGVFSRPIHETKRSFSKPARRAREEKVLILRKPEKKLRIYLKPPLYKMWDYEAKLREIEISSLLGFPPPLRKEKDGSITLELGHEGIAQAERLTFTKELVSDIGFRRNTWQKTLENGDSETTKRKEPKYTTHGIHSFKGKFYPQLAKSLLNISATPIGAIVLDPFCGSGTVPLECFLNGYRAFGCDMNPLAAKIAEAKSGILSVDRQVCADSIESILHMLQHQPSHIPFETDQFIEIVKEDLFSWFPKPIIYKMNWLLHHIRLFGNKTVVSFLEVILSSIIREISQQDPTDLRIRRRAEPIKDAPVIELFKERLAYQYERLRKYWQIASRKPCPTFAPVITNGNSCDWVTFERLGLSPSSVDIVVTSPPYATALPYIDTDRLSLMAVMGIPSSERALLERSLTGSREIAKSERKQFEEILFSTDATNLLPESIVQALQYIHKINSSSDVGFRRANMASLLWRYFSAMQINVQNVYNVLKSGGTAYYIVGNSQTQVGNTWFEIPTCDFICEVAAKSGFQTEKFINISVTTENLKHVKNAITNNLILRFTRE